MDNCTTGSFSRMASECQKCPDKYACQNKRKEAVAYIIPSSMPMQPMGGMAQSLCPSCGVTVNIQMPSIEELSMQIERNIARKASLCAFGEVRR